MVTSALASYRPLASSALAFNWCIYWYLKKTLVLNSSILNNDWYELTEINEDMGLHLIGRPLKKTKQNGFKIVINMFYFLD
jgi:hypothetical protein